MPDQYLERHMDYVHDVDTQIGTLAANTKYPGLPLQLEADAPFVMRALACRMEWHLTTGQTNLSQIWIRLKRANGSFFMTEYVPLSQMTGNFGLGGNPYPIWPHEFFPGNGIIEVDIWNNGAQEIAGFHMVYRGVKRFAPKQSLYPEKFRPLNFTRSIKVTNVGISPPTGRIDSYIISPVVDADFVLRHIQAGCVFNDNSPSPFFAARNVFIRLRDNDGHTYSNIPVDWNILCGASSGAYPTGSFANALQTGPFHPGLFYPEIYVLRERVLMMDILRDDSAYLGEPGIGTERLDFAFGGMKVFAK